ncbi:hypothetical protein EXS71_00425 [Candidatus Uhrbacteria bacterium]|nr:hypothetical protein [Candidatus Uhrbacteria bacterium]
MSKSNRSKNIKKDPRSNKSRGRIIVITVLIALVVVISWWQIPTENPPTVSANSDQALQVSETRLERWNGSPAPVHPSPEDVTRQAELFKEFERFPYTPDSVSPLRDQALRAKVDQAKEMILGQPMVQGAWEWPEVQRMIAELDRTIPIVEPPARVANVQGPIMGYDGGADRLMIWPTMVARESAEEISHHLVHEITHGIVKRKMMDALHVYQDSFGKLAMTCQDLDGTLLVVTEALAYTNQASWIASRPNLRSLLTTPVLDGSMSRQGQQMAFAASQSKSAIPAFAEFLKSYKDMSNTSVRRRSPIAIRTCGPPIAIDGPRKGEYVYPTELNPPLLIPLLNHF